MDGGESIGRRDSVECVIGIWRWIERLGILCSELNGVAV
jgi:hypothetical protein